MNIQTSVTTAGPRLTERTLEQWNRWPALRRRLARSDLHGRQKILLAAAVYLRTVRVLRLSAVSTNPYLITPIDHPYTEASRQWQDLQQIAM
jgi:hypothetical protein